jgi:hypothetical protein
MKIRWFARHSLRMGTAALLGVSALSCTTFTSHAEIARNERSAIYRAILQRVREWHAIDLDLLRPMAMPNSRCACDPGTAQYLTRQLPGLQLSTLESFCANPSAPPTNRELRALKAFTGHSGNSLTWVEISGMGFPPDHSQALVCVAKLDHGAYWLLEKQGTEWAVEISALSWVLD